MPTAARASRANLNGANVRDDFTNVVLQGDAVALLSEMPDASVHLTVFSPPYDGIRDYGKDWSFDSRALGSEASRVGGDGEPTDR
ncbi:MAG: hypothetical protein IT437_08785 [Phycisphaerales bacterium]|nr:hypothetical protein [Phycisphaerales bacterium]